MKDFRSTVFAIVLAGLFLSGPAGVLNDHIHLHDHDAAQSELHHDSEAGQSGIALSECDYCTNLPTTAVESEADKLAFKTLDSNAGLEYDPLLKESAILARRPRGPPIYLC